MVKGWLWPMLSLGAIAGLGGLSLGQPQLCGLVALADAVRFFGRDGSPGSTGSSGRAGAAGGDRRYRTRFQGPLPTPLISRQQNRFELTLGRLPLGLRDRQGDEIRLELQVTRSLGPYSAIQTLEWLGQW